MPTELNASTIVTGILASIGGILMGWAALRKSRSDGQGAVVTNAVSIINELQEELGRVKAEVNELKAREKERDAREKERDAREKERDAWELEILAGIRILSQQLRDAGITPKWTPPATRPGDSVDQHSHDRGELPKQQRPKPKTKRGL